MKANVRPRVQILDRKQTFKINMTSELYNKILTALIADVGVTDNGDAIYRTEMYSHANMTVVGRYVYVISDTGQIADVNLFTPDYPSMKIPIIDAAIQ